MLLVPLWLLWARSRTPVSRAGFWLSGLMRSAALAALLMALALPVRREADEPGRRLLVPVIDGSLSVPPAEKKRAEGLLRAALTSPEGAKAQVPRAMVFGRRSLPVPGNPWDFGHVLEDATQRENWQDSQLAAALLDAASQVRAGDAAAVVVFSDGNTTDDCESALNMLERAAIPVHVVPLESMAEDGYRVIRLDSPRQVFEGDRFDFSTVIESSRSGRVRVFFRRSGKLIHEREVTLQAGLNTVSHDMEADEPGLLRLEVQVDPVDIQDQFRETNDAMSLTRVVEVPRALVVSERPREGNPLVLSMEAMGMKADVIPVTAFPATSAELDKNAAIVLDDVPASAFKPESFRLIERFVKETGGGFLMAGRRQSFGPGGYRDTVIEEILPVNLPTAGYSASSAVVLVLDVSGSMEGDKFEASKEASKVLMRQLTDRMVSIVIFSDMASVALPMTLIQNEFDEIDRVIDAIPLGGGTMYSPAIAGALQMLDQVGAPSRYIVMLSDGAPSDYWAIPQVMNEVRTRNTQLSTIAIGAADPLLLEEMATQGGGRFYQPESLDHLAEAFKEESTHIVKGDPMVKNPAVPVLAPDHPMLKGFQQADFPLIHEYVGTALKERAELVLSSPSGDPNLAVWRYGLGMTAAFTTDAGGAGNRDWLPWTGYPKFWSQVMKHLFRDRVSDFTLRSEIVGETGQIVVDAIDVEGRYLDFQELEAVVELPSVPGKAGEVMKVILPQSQSGRYEGAFPASFRGFYPICIQRRKSGEKLLEGGATRTVTSELTGRPTNIALLSELVDRTRGGWIRSAEDLVQVVNKLQPQPRERAEPLWPWFAAGALLLFFLEIALRRLGFFHKKAETSASDPEIAMMLGKARGFVSMAKDLEAGGQKAKAQAYYLKAHSLLLKSGAEEEARRAWERYRLLDR